MSQENRIKALVQAFHELVDEASMQSQTKLFPSLEIIDDTPTELGANYIIVKDPEDHYAPALKVPGLTYTTGDFVNVMSVRGSEFIAFQQATGSSGVNGLWSQSGSDIYYSAGDVGISNSSPETALHVGIGADTPTHAYDGVYACMSGNAQVSVRNANADVEGGIFTFSSGSQVFMGSWTDDDLALRTNNVNRMYFDTSGQVFINDTANTTSTIGLTINQAANTNDIFTLKSSNVAHGMTTITETDTWCSIRLQNSTNGGVQFRGLTDGGTNAALRLRAIAGAAASTTESTSATAPFMMDASIKSGTSVADVGSNGNLLTVRNNITTRFIFKEDGTGLADVAWNTFSDIRLKTNVRDSPYGLTEILQINPIQYNRIDKMIVDEEARETVDTVRQEVSLGFSAQEIKLLIPELVRDVSDDDFYSMNYDAMTVVLVKAVQELHAEVQELKKELRNVS